MVRCPAFAMPAAVWTIALALWMGAYGADRGLTADPPAGPPPRTAWIPADALISLEVSRPEEALDPLLDPKLAGLLQSLPGYSLWSQSPGYQQFLAGVALVEAQLGTDWRTAIRKLAGGGLSIAVRADGSTILVADATDDAFLRKSHEVFVNLTRMDAAGKGEPDRVKSAEHRGITWWSLGPEEFHAVVGERLLLANRKDALQAAIDLRDGEGSGALEESPLVREGRRALGGRPFATAHLDLAKLKMHPGLQRALEGTKEPLVSLLFGGVTEALRASNWIALGLARTPEGLRLDAVADGKPAAGFAVPPPSAGGALENLEVPGRIAALSLWRDLHSFYSAKDALFPERTAGLIFFENMMGIFFSGLDLTDEVFGETEPEIRLVVAKQRYDPRIGTPRVRLPGFALLLRMKRPEPFGEVMEEAWQKALGLANFTRGQKAEPGMIIDKDFHDGVKYTVAYFRAPPEARSDVDVRFNFRPSLARTGDTLILSSTDGLVRDLIDALRKENAQGASAKRSHSVLVLDGVGLMEILEANRESMIANNMVDKGNTREQAEIEVGLLLAIVRHVTALELEVGERGDRTAATLRLSLGAAEQKSVEVRAHRPTRAGPGERIGLDASARRASSSRVGTAVPVAVVASSTEESHGR